MMHGQKNIKLCIDSFQHLGGYIFLNIHAVSSALKFKEGRSIILRNIAIYQYTVCLIPTVSEHRCQ
jgi:hypothetical protein